MSEAPVPLSTPARYARLAKMLVKYGRSDLVQNANIEGFVLPDDAPVGDEPTAEAFTADLEALGPMYVKLGQLLSTRDDLLPPAYTSSLARLQDKTAEVAFEDIEEVFQEEVGQKISALFTSFDVKPLASASLGQVHAAVTKSGKSVAVKVQRPGVREEIRQDLEALMKLAEVADKRTAVGKTYGFTELITTFGRSLAAKLDYRREARNATRFAEVAEAYEDLAVPKPLPDYCTPRILTLEKIEGVKLTDAGPLRMLDVDGEALADSVFRFYLATMLGEGVVHADPHPGNILLTDDGRLALLDFGMVAAIAPRVRAKLLKLLGSIADGNGEEAAELLASMGTKLEAWNAEGFRSDVTSLVTDAVASGSDVQAGTVLVGLARVSGARGLRPPAEMTLVGKALANLDQAVLHLDEHFEPSEAIRENALDAATGALKPSLGGMLSAAVDAKEFTERLPARANRILDDLSTGAFRIKVDALDQPKLHDVLQRIANRAVLGLIIASTVIGAALMAKVEGGPKLFGYPAISTIFFLIAVAAGAVLGLHIALTDRKARKKQALDE